MDVDNAAAGGAGMLHILAIIDAERYETARPAPVVNKNSIKTVIICPSTHSFYRLNINNNLGSEERRVNKKYSVPHKLQCVIVLQQSEHVAV